MSMEKVLQALKTLAQKVGVETLVEAITEALKESIKGHANDAIKVTKARWLGLGLGDEAAFSAELARLGPTGTQEIISFLKTIGPRESNLFRLIVTTLEEMDLRQKILQNIADLPDNQARLDYFNEVISKPEYLEDAARWVAKNFLYLCGRLPDFAAWCWDVLWTAYPHVANAARVAVDRAQQVADEVNTALDRLGPAVQGFHDQQVDKVRNPHTLNFVARTLRGLFK